MEVNLSSKSWHYKLQVFSLGENKPDLHSLCPYFWLTIFCIAFLPLILIVKSFISFNEWFYNILESNLNGFVDGLSPAEIGSLYNYEKVPGKPFLSKKMSAYSMFCRWKKRQEDSGKSYEEIKELTDVAYRAYIADRQAKQDELDKAREAMAEYYEAEKVNQAKRDERSRKMKLMWIPVVTWTKRIFNLALTGVIMVLVTWTINFLIMSFNPDATLIGLKVMGIVLVFIGAIVGLIFLIKMYVEWNVANSRIPILFRPFKMLGSPLGSFFNGIGKVFKWIFSGFSLFWEYFKANKNDYCPAINWDTDATEDDNE